MTAMRAANVTLVIVVSTLLVLNLSGITYAFHSGGVGECGGCHSMHGPKPGGSFLLLGTDPGSTCLICHQQAGDTGPFSYHVSTASADMPAGIAPKQRTAGGDFGWLKKSYTYTVDGATITEDGSTHGHNIVAADFNYVVDPANTIAPGGTFPATQLACTSCHDPHGKYRRLSTNTIAASGAPIIDSGSYDTSPVPAPGQAVGVYRLLAGGGYTKGSVTFNGVPPAVTPFNNNRTESTTQTRTAYGYAGTGGHVSWADWCATCHPSTHSSGSTGHKVEEQLGSTIASIYNTYKKSGDLTGTQATAFLSLVPFAENTGDYAILASHARSDDSYLTGPSSQDRMLCLSCHRAHASGWENAFRWKTKGEFIVYNSLYPGTDTTPTLPQYARGRTSAETQAAYYDRPVTVFATYQRSLCNKCHAKD